MKYIGIILAILIIILIAVLKCKGVIADEKDDGIINSGKGWINVREGAQFIDWGDSTDEDGGIDYWHVNKIPDIFVVVMEIYQWVSAEVDDDVYYYNDSDSKYHRPNNLAFVGEGTGFYKQEFIAIYKKDFAVSYEAAEGLAKIWDEEGKNNDGYLISSNCGIFSGTYYPKLTGWSKRPHAIHKVFVYELTIDGRCNKKQLIPSLYGDGFMIIYGGSR